MRKYLLTMMMCFACVALLRPSPVKAEESLVLENDRVALRFDRDTGTLTALENKLAKETYSISKDEFAVEAGEFRLGFPDAQLTSLELQGEALLARGWPMMASYAACRFQNGLGGGELTKWDGTPSGYEGFLSHCYRGQLALFTGHYGIGFGPEGFCLEPWSPLKGKRVKLGLKYMGKIVEEIE